MMRWNTQRIYLFITMSSPANPKFHNQAQHCKRTTWTLTSSCPGAWSLPRYIAQVLLDTPTNYHQLNSQHTICSESAITLATRSPRRWHPQPHHGLISIQRYQLSTSRPTHIQSWSHVSKHSRRRWRTTSSRTWRFEPTFSSSTRAVRKFASRALTPMVLQLHAAQHVRFSPRSTLWSPYPL